MYDEIGTVVYKIKENHVSEFGLYLVRYDTFDDGTRYLMPMRIYVISAYNHFIHSCIYLDLNDDWHYTDIKVTTSVWEQITIHENTEELCKRLGIKYYFEEDKKENIDMNSKSDTFNIKDVRLDLEKLDNEVSGFIACQNKDPYIFMNNETLSVLPDCAGLYLKQNPECKDGYFGMYNGYKVFCNNDLNLGEVELR